MKVALHDNLIHVISSIPLGSKEEKSEIKYSLIGSPPPECFIFHIWVAGCCRLPWCTIACRYPLGVTVI